MALAKHRIEASCPCGAKFKIVSDDVYLTERRHKEFIDQHRNCLEVWSTVLLRNIELEITQSEPTTNLRKLDRRLR